MPTIVRPLFVALLALSLVACGFHLRGQGPASALQYRSAKVIGNGGAFNELNRQLQLMQINLNAAEPEITIQILSEGTDKQVLSVNNNGQVSEYRLFYRIHFSASRAGEMLIDDQTISLQRNISWDENSVLSKESEEANLIREMQRDGASQIVRRINAASKGINGGQSVASKTATTSQ